MFSKIYFNNLYKENRLLILFITLISSLLCFSDNSSLLIALLTLTMSYVIPMMVFKFIHNSKAVDTYYSLPVSRKALLFTGLIFSLFAVFTPFFVSSVVDNIINENLSLLSFVLYIGIGIIVILTMVCFNTLLYQVANNVFDGIVAILAYSLLPLFIYIVTTIFFEVFVCGYNIYNVELFGYLSPVYTSALLLFRHFDSYDFLFNLKDLNYLLTLLFYLTISIVLLFKYFPKRKVERANESSSNFFAYPLIIYLYTSLCLFGISCNYQFTSNVANFVKEFVVFYILCFALFVLAHFVYKRKFYFNAKMIVFFVLSIVISLTFCFAAFKTKGFGISEKDNLSDTYVKYSIEIVSENDKINDYIHEKTNEMIIDKYIWINIETQDKQINDELFSLLKGYKQNAINQFYSKKSTINSYMNVYDNYVINGDTEGFDRNYHYNFYSDLDNLEVLFKLVEYDEVKIHFYTNNAEYLMLKNKDLLAINIYNY